MQTNTDLGMENPVLRTCWSSTTLTDINEVRQSWVDCKKAFETEQDHRLVQKLRCTVLQWVKEYLISQWGRVMCEVPQESVLGSLLCQKSTTY